MLEKVDKKANAKLETCNSVSIEETVVINPNAKVEDDEEIIEIEPEMVKYHSGQTPHPNRFDPLKVFNVMSEAEDDDEIIEVQPSDVHIHDSTMKTSLLVPPSPSRSLSKSPSPHLAILSDFITKKMDREKTPIIVQEAVQVENVMTSTVQESFSLETAVVSTVQVEHEQHENSSVMNMHQSTEIQESSVSQNNEDTKELFVIDKQESKVMEELFDKLVAEESVKINKVEKSRSFDAIENWIMKSESFTETKNETSQDAVRAEKLKNKRNRNKTMDFSALDNSWYEATATCTSKTFAPPAPPPLVQESQETQTQDKPKLAIGVQTSLSTETDSSEPETPNAGLADKTKPGLCLIIDKLKSIETKLDEMKTFDNPPPMSPSSPLFLLPEVGPTPTQPNPEPTKEDFKILQAEENVIPTTNAIGKNFVLNELVVRRFRPSYCSSAHLMQHPSHYDPKRVA